MDGGQDLIDRAALKRLRTETGPAFARLVGYFREDAATSILAAEDAARRRDAAALIRPAHTLKGEALQFGAGPLAALAERIETDARLCVETQGAPDALMADVPRLRPLLARTLTLLMQETAAAPAARPVFGRRTSTPAGR